MGTVAGRQHGASQRSRGESGASSRGQQGDSWQSGRKIPGFRGPISFPSVLESSKQEYKLHSKELQFPLRSISQREEKQHSPLHLHKIHQQGEAAIILPCSRPLGGATQLGERRLHRGSADNGTFHPMSAGWNHTKWRAFAGTGHRMTSALALMYTNNLPWPWNQSGPG